MKLIIQGTKVAGAVLDSYVGGEITIPAPEGFDPQKIGQYRYVGGVLTDVPQVVTMRQARLALLNAGLLDTVNAAVSAAGGSAAIEWEFAQEVERNWTTLISLQPTLGLTDEQIDDLFRLAITL